MLKDLVSNATLLIAAFTVMGQIFKNKPLQHNSKNSLKIYWGICYGLLGIILMLFSFQINSTTIADLRHLAIVIAAAFGGYIPAIIASGIIALGRIFLFGFNDTAMLAAINALLTGIVCGWFSTLKYHPTLKAFYMNLIGLFFISIVFIIYIEDKTILTNVLIIHYLISLVGGFFAYHLSVYIAITNETERQLNLSLKKLTETEERFRLLAEYSSDIISMHNETSVYKYISPAVNEIIQFNYKDLLGRKLEEFIHPEDIVRTNEVFEKTLREGFADTSYRFRTNRGDYVWIESTLKRVNTEDDRSKRVIIVSRNITARKETELKLHKANELLNRLSFMDGLTAIGNRRHFDETLNKEWSSLTSLKSPLTLLMFDIDYFKKYNDTYGHLAGDHCLQTIAESIKKLVSNKSNYTFCRYGGEEFAIILSSTQLTKGIHLAKLIQQELKELNIEHKSSEISTIVTLSIGLATVIPTTENSPKELIHLADTALYTSKTKGRNTISTS